MYVRACVRSFVRFCVCVVLLRARWVKGTGARVGMCLAVALLCVCVRSPKRWRHTSRQTSPHTSHHTSRQTSHHTSSPRRVTRRVKPGLYFERKPTPYTQTVLRVISATNADLRRSDRADSVYKHSYNTPTFTLTFAPHFEALLTRCHELSLPLNRVCTGQSSGSERALDQWQCAAVTPQVNLSFSFVSCISKHLIECTYCYREFIVGIVVSAIAVFRLVDNILSSTLHC